MPKFLQPQKKKSIMSRPRKPTNVLELTGSLNKNPSRREARTDEPRNLDELGKSPERLTAQQKEAWNEIANNCPHGVLTKADRHALEMTAVLLAEFWANGIQMQGTHLSLLNTLLAKMGMNPSDRSRVTVREPKNENPFSKHARR